MKVRLKIPETQALLNDSNIVKDPYRFYFELDTSNCIPCSKVQKAILTPLPKTTPYVTQKDICEKKLSTAEIFKTVKSINNTRIPGLDGLTPKFYKTFWSTLKYLFMHMLHETYLVKKLPSLTCTVIY